MHEEDELEDYLSQFEDSPKFDSEDCPTCGLDFSSPETFAGENKVRIAKCSFRVKAEEIVSKLQTENIECEILFAQEIYSVLISREYLENAIKVLTP